MGVDWVVMIQNINIFLKSVILQCDDDEFSALRQVRDDIVIATYHRRLEKWRCVEVVSGFLPSFILYPLSSVIL